MMDTAMGHIGEKTFTHEDQQWFAAVSGDCNPIHVDASAARRLMTGRELVHGIHVMLAAIDAWQSRGATLSSVACTFSHPISVGDPVAFSQADATGDDVIVEATVRGRSCARLTISTGDRQSTARGDGRSGAPIAASLAELVTPLDQEPATHVGQRYTVALRPADVSARYPRAQACLGAARLAAIVRLSYFVGMVCPGLHSLFSSVTVTLRPDDADLDALTFVVETFKPGYHLFDISFDGAISGRLKAFQRPQPQAQPSIESLRPLVTPGEFARSRSLIIGGSRGLGEVTAKLLAAGGGDVVVTYATGQADAERVQHEIAAAGGVCDVAAVDLTRAWPSRLADGALDAVYFFATPMIARTRAALFDPDLFREFCDMYVTRFHEMCVALEAGGRERPVTVFFPSTVYVAERATGMLEYSMAKLAAEHLIEEINRTFTRVRVVSARLPRLNTDQTSSIVKKSMPPIADILLPLIRTVQTGAPRS